MVASAVSLEPDVIQDWASKYAEIAMTASQAATALRLMMTDPDRTIPSVYRNALLEMADIIATISELKNRDRLSALIDRSLGTVESFEPAQMVARLASEQDDNSETKSRIDSILKFKSDLDSVIETPDADKARTIVPIFRSISHDAMDNALRAEEALGVDGAVMRSRLIGV